MLKKAAIAIAAYVLCWIAVHCVVMLIRGDGLSLGYLFHDFKLAWGFSAGELPTFIWLVSLGLYAALLVAWFVASKWQRIRMA